MLSVDQACIEVFNFYAYVSVGIYGYSWCRASAHVIEIFASKAPTSISGPPTSRRESCLAFQTTRTSFYLITPQLLFVVAAAGAAAGGGRNVGVHGAVAGGGGGGPRVGLPRRYPRQ